MIVFIFRRSARHRSILLGSVRIGCSRRPRRLVRLDWRRATSPEDDRKRKVQSGSSLSPTSIVLLLGLFSLILCVGVVQFGYDQGVPATFKATEDGTWTLPVMDRWPSLIQVNIFGFDDYFLGDADGDGVIDRLPPNSLTANYFNSSSLLPSILWDSPCA